MAVSSIGSAQVPYYPPMMKLDASLVYAGGDYGLPADTDVFIGLLNPTLETVNWRFQASLPYIHLDGPASVVGDTGPASGSRSVHGVGDASLAVTRKMLFTEHGWTTEFGGKMKFPTANEAKGLGTGEVDTSFQVDVFKVGGHRFTPFGTLGYQFRGRSAAYRMEDGAFATVGVAGQTAPSTTVGIAGTWRARTISGGESAVEAMGFAQQRLSDDLNLQVFLMHGFTTASPDVALGMTLGYSY